jgi:hypothetical protein
MAAIAGRLGVADLHRARLARLIDAAGVYIEASPSRAARWAEELRQTAQVADEHQIPGGLFVGAAELLDAVRPLLEAAPGGDLGMILDVVEDGPAAGTP